LIYDFSSWEYVAQTVEFHVSVNIAVAFFNFWGGFGSPYVELTVACESELKLLLEKKTGMGRYEIESDSHSYWTQKSFSPFLLTTWLLKTFPSPFVLSME
jgi:hypothetical protein